MRRAGLAVAVCLALSCAAGSAAATPVSPIPAAPTAGNQLHYFGGHVLSSVDILAVFWTKNANAQTQANIGKFYSTIVASPYLDWLTEYDTIGLLGEADGKPGSNQHIGRGTYSGAITITPFNTSTSITDADVAKEVVAQIQAGNLPPPKKDATGSPVTIYMIDFPSSVTIDLFGWKSCQNYGAYHFTTTMNGESITYGVHPDCSNSWDWITVVHSHELIEAITDMEVGLVDQQGPNVRPLGWVTLAQTAWANQEIADICQGGPHGTIEGYAVAKGWSNFANACVAEIPVCTWGVDPPACRPCSQYDSGNACGGAEPACALGGPRKGQCVSCTSKYAVACSGATPVCDDATYSCVQCVTTADCKDPAKPVCEDATNTCRGCRVDGECPSGEVCASGTCAPPPKPDAGSPPLVDAGGGDDAGDLGDQPSAPAASDSGCGCRAAEGSREDGKTGRVGWLMLAAALVGRQLARRRRSRCARPR